jgi:hypothetical protein
MFQTCLGGVKLFVGSFLSRYQQMKVCLDWQIFGIEMWWDVVGSVRFFSWLPADMGVPFDNSIDLRATVFWCLLDSWIYFSLSTGTDTALPSVLLKQGGWEEPTDGFNFKSFFFPDLSWGLPADLFRLSACKSVHPIEQSFLSRRQYGWQFDRVSRGWECLL